MLRSQFLTVTNVLIVLCVLAFAADQLFVSGRSSGFELFYIQSDLFKPIQLLSYLFLHASITHLLLNMLGLWMFGSVIERVWGAQRFIIFYLVCGIGAGVIYLAFNYIQFQWTIAPLLEAHVSSAQVIQAFSDNRLYTVLYQQFPDIEQAAIIFFTPMVGASAAIYAVLVAFACLFPNYKVMLLFFPVPIAAKFFVPALLCFDLLSGLTGFSIFGANVAHSAHIAGAVMGFAFVLLFRQKASTSQ